MVAAARLPKLRVGLLDGHLVVDLLEVRLEVLLHQLLHLDRANVEVHLVLPVGKRLLRARRLDVLLLVRLLLRVRVKPRQLAHRLRDALILGADRRRHLRAQPDRRQVDRVRHLLLGEVRAARLLLPLRHRLEHLLDDALLPDGRLGVAVGRQPLEHGAPVILRVVVRRVLLCGRRVAAVHERKLGARDCQLGRRLHRVLGVLRIGDRRQPAGLVVHIDGVRKEGAHRCGSVPRGRCTQRTPEVEAKVSIETVGPRRRF
eukprot:73870-Prymnesium_polylepis.1